MMRTVIVGSRHYEGAIEALADLPAGTSLILVRDREGRDHDPNAVAVLFGTQMLGYIPRFTNGEVARRMDEGEEASARIVVPAFVRGTVIAAEPRIEILWGNYS